MYASCGVRSLDRRLVTPEERVVCATKDLNRECLAKFYELWGFGASRNPKIMAGKKPARRLLRNSRVAPCL